MRPEDRSKWTEENVDDLIAVDFETWFDMKEGISLKNMSVWEYVFHPKTFPYMMSIKTSRHEWCGDPREFHMWDLFENKIACAHNASFDGLIWKRMERDGAVPKGCSPRRWVCTADLAAYLRIRRNLQTVVKELYGETISKQERADADGKTAEDMKADGSWEPMVRYGQADATWCWRIAKDNLQNWPATAQYVSQLNREAAWRGFAVDAETIRGTPEKPGVLEDMKNKLFEYGRAIPWFPDEPALSPTALRAQARKDNILVPASLAKTSDEATEFFEKHSAAFPWVGAIRDFRQANTMLRKLETLDRGIREDGTFPYSSVYFGANTGRLTAGTGGNSEESSGKFNLFNLPRGELQGVDLRKLIVPRKGFKLFVGDYSQIEARLLLWRAGDKETLDKIRGGYSIYEAEAERLLGMRDAVGLKERDPGTYHMVKGTVLGSGYQMGAPRFFVQAPALTGGKYRPTMQEAYETIAKYRDTHPHVVNYWSRHQTFLMSSAYNEDPTHSVQLASGRWLTYYEPVFAETMDQKTGKARREIVVRQVRGEPHKRMYGGKLTENEMQATGFDILCDAWAAMADAGFSVAWTLYDEFVVEVPEKTAEDCGKELEKIMVSSSPWADGLPLGAEWKIMDRYGK